MARYFFDVDDGDLSRDDEGLDFVSVDAACDQALASLPDIAKGCVSERTKEEVSITVRDGGDRAVFRATLVIKAEWLVDAP